MTNTVSYLELFFTSVGAFGLLVLLTGLPEIIEDLRYASQKRKAARPQVIVALEVKLRTARGNIRRELGRIISLCGCVAVGWNFMIRPDSGGQGRPSLSAILISGVIIIMECNIVLQSIVDRWDRRALIDIIVGPKRTLDEVVAAELQQRRRHYDLPPDMTDKTPPGK